MKLVHDVPVLARHLDIGPVNDGNMVDMLELPSAPGEEVELALLEGRAAWQQDDPVAVRAVLEERVAEGENGRDVVRPREDGHDGFFPGLSSDMTKHKHEYKVAPRSVSQGAPSAQKQKQTRCADSRATRA